MREPVTIPAPFLITIKSYYLKTYISSGHGL